MFLTSLTIECLSVVLGLPNGDLFRKNIDNNLASIYLHGILMNFPKQFKRLFAISEAILRKLLKRSMEFLV